MDESILNKKVSEAIEVTTELVQFFHDNHAQGLEMNFKFILALLETGKIKEAIIAQGEFTGAKFLETAEILSHREGFSQLMDRQMELMVNIQLYIEYDIDK